MGMGLVAIGGQVAATTLKKDNFRGALRHVRQTSAEWRSRSASQTMQGALKTALPGDWQPPRQKTIIFMTSHAIHPINLFAR